VKVFPNEAFGYQRITVERPLRIRYLGEGARERLEASKAFAKLADDRREQIAAVVTGLSDLSTVDRAEVLRVAAGTNGMLTKPEEKALLDALAIRDPEATALDEADPELRDYENVPLPEEPVASFEPDPSERLASEPYRRAIEEYMAAEVLPYVSDAWVDQAKTKIGYEIPLTRQFYKYVPPRPLDEIDAEIRALEDEIQELLGRVTQ